MKSIQLKTEVPGPNSKALMQRRRRFVARGPFHTTPIFAKKAHGSIIEDVDGNHFIDFGSGIGVVNVGHTPEKVVKAIKTQSEMLIHSSFNITPYEVYIELCQKLTEVTPGKFEKKVFLANSGAEAVENAIKIARAYTGRQAVICFDHAFHGRTYMALSLTSKATPYKSGFAPFNPEVYRVPFPYAYRSNNPDNASDDAFLAFEEIAHSQIGEKNIAAVIFEPVLGEGGFIPMPKDYANRLRRFCTQHGIVMIADEIQSGFGRTGQMFACDTLGVDPDLITLAKGLGAGMPISAVVGRSEIMDAPGDGGIGGTYGGNPLSCVSALEVIRIFQDPKTLEQIKVISSILENELQILKNDFEVIGDVRGLGTMRAIELVKDRKTKEPNKEATGRLIQYAYTHGVILLSAGTYSNVIRLLMPLTINESDLMEGLSVIREGLKNG